MAVLDYAVPMRILGIDPGLRVTGYGLVEVADRIAEPHLIDAGIICLEAQQPIEERLAQLHDDLADLVGELRPSHLVVEKLYAHYRHPRTAILMAHARGVILVVARRHLLAVDHLPATEIKKAITGHGHASKQQMQAAIQTQCHLPELPSPPDVADAIAIALCYGRRLLAAH